MLSSPGTLEGAGDSKPVTPRKEARGLSKELFGRRNELFQVGKELFQVGNELSCNGKELFQVGNELSQARKELSRSGKELFPPPGKSFSSLGKSILTLEESFPRSCKSIPRCARARRRSFGPLRVPATAVAPPVGPRTAPPRERIHLAREDGPRPDERTSRVLEPADTAVPEGVFSLSKTLYVTGTTPLPPRRRPFGPAAARGGPPLAVESPARS